MGGSRPNENDFCFLVVSRIYHNSSYVQRISRNMNGKPVNVWVCLCCREKFQKFLTWAETEPENGGFSSILCTAYVKKILNCIQVVPMESVEKFAEFSSVIIFQIQTKMHDHQRMWHMGGSRPFVIRKIHHNSSYILRISRTPNPRILLSSINLFSPSCLT